MKLANTTGDLFKYLPDDPQRVSALKNCGFSNIDMSFYDGCKRDWIYFEPDWQDKTHALLEHGKSIGVQFVQAHCPGGNFLGDEEHIQLLLKSTVRSLELCEILGIKNAVYHAGWRTGICKEDYFKANRAIVERLIPTIEKTGVSLCVENSTKVNMRDMYYFFTGEDMAEFLEEINHPLVNACWDTGHANIEGHQYSDLVALGDRLTAIHFNDNHGAVDEHILPFAGTMSIDEIMNGLIHSGFKGYLTFECDGGLLMHDNWLFRRRAYPEDTRALNPALPLKLKQIEQLYETGKYILSRYGLCEE